MVTVPKYDRVTVQPTVGQVSIPQVRVNVTKPIEAFGGGGEEVLATQEKLTGTVNKIIETEINRADDLVITDAKVKISELKNDLFYNPENGASTKKGKAASTVTEDYELKFNKGVEKIEEGLNSRQKIRFANIKASEHLELITNLEKHTFIEAQKYENQISESAIASAKNDAVLNYQILNKVNESVLSVETEVNKIADRNGIRDPATRKLMIDNEVSSLHTQVISRMLANEQDILAKKYYVTYKEDIRNAKDVETIERALEEGSTRGESQRKSLEIYSQGGTLSEQLAQADKIENPKVQEMTKQQIRQRFSDQENSEKLQQETIYMKGANLIDNDKSGRTPRELLSPVEWSSLPINMKVALENRANDPQNNDKIWLDFLDLTAKDVAGLNRTEFESKYWVKFDKEHRAKAESYWNAAKEAIADPGKANQFNSLFTDKDMILETMKASNLIKASDTYVDIAKSEEKAKLTSAFMREVDNAFKSFFVTNGKNPTDDQKKKIVSNLLLRKVYVDQWFSDIEKPVAVLTPEEKKKVYIPIDRIPNQAKIEILNIARSNGIVHPTMNDEMAMRILRKKIEKAYASFLVGEGVERIKQIVVEE